MMSILPDPGKPTVLVAVLNWGLGHAVRSIPMIRNLSKAGCEVLMASDGEALEFLRRSFPELPSIELPSYKIRYPLSSMYLNMGIQGPKILKTARSEFKVIQKTIKEYAVRGILSDARFGCFSTVIPSIFISHQVHLPIPDPVFYPLVNFFQKQLFQQYTELWIPDFPAPYSLAGKLSANPPISHARYIGLLSDMKLAPHLSKPDIDILAVLSGPEPQRSLFEEQIILQARKTSNNIIIVSGKPKVSRQSSNSENLSIIPFLDRASLYHYICRSNIILSRSGYTTLMDLAKLGKNAILIPTPGQTEQEYLAQRHHKLGHFYTVSQKKFDLVEAWQQGRNRFSGIPANYLPNTGEALLKAAMHDFIARL